MNKTSKPNSMLIELVIVLLFFSLSAAVILQLFFAAHNASVRASVDSSALMMAEDVAERFSVSDLTADAFLAADGWTMQDDHFTRDVTEQKRTLRFTANTASEPAAAGTLETMSLTVTDGDTEIVTLPIVRYTPEEGTP